MENIFNDKLLVEMMNRMKISKRNYIIATSSFCDSYSYCLAYGTNSDFHFLLCRTIKDETEFNEEVNNLSQYFNATILKENI